MSLSRRLLCPLFLLAGALPVAAGQPGTAGIQLQAGGSYTVPVVSLRDTRFQQTIHQQFDFSCGSAALATLLTYHYNFPVSEQTIFRTMYERGDKAKIQKEGFSLLDIKNYLASVGFQSDGYIVGIDKLAVAGIPAIALIKERGYHHFVVLKGLRDGRILMGDPSAGTRAVPLEKFKEMWVNGVLFVIKNKQNEARFNLASDWRVVPTASFSEGLYHGSRPLAFPKHGPGDF